MRYPSLPAGTLTGSTRKRSTPCCSKVGLRKGPWAAEEDEILASYIKREGHAGGWRTLPKRAGLLRCGKSCRLRWMNYLRPSVKRGQIAADEEDLILRLHRLLGNRWALIAGRIPGRTDNEIKNYWNTHLSKKLINQGIDPRTHKPLNPNLDSSGNINNSIIPNPNPNPSPNPKTEPNPSSSWLEETADGCTSENSKVTCQLDQYQNPVVNLSANGENWKNSDAGSILMGSESCRCHENYHCNEEDNIEFYNFDDNIFSSYLNFLYKEEVGLNQQANSALAASPIISQQSLINSMQTFNHGMTTSLWNEVSLASPTMATFVAREQTGSNTN